MLFSCASPSCPSSLPPALLISSEPRLCKRATRVQERNNKSDMTVWSVAVRLVSWGGTGASLYRQRMQQQRGKLPLCLPSQAPHSSGAGACLSCPTLSMAGARGLCQHDRPRDPYWAHYVIVERQSQ